MTRKSRFLTAACALSVFFFVGYTLFNIQREGDIKPPPIKKTRDGVTKNEESEQERRRKQTGDVVYKPPTLNTTAEHENNTTLDGNEKMSENEKLRINHYFPVNSPDLIGEEFNFDVPTALMMQNFLRNQTFRRKPVSIDPNTPIFDLVVPVTGASSNHYGEFRTNIEHFSNNFAGTRVIFYDLGLTESQVNEVKMLPFVTFRKFNFDSYPPHVRNLHNYAWKPLIIQQVLAEFDGAMWFDTSVVFKKNSTLTHLLERMARFNSGFLFYVRSTGHSIQAATHPDMLKHFPIKKAHAVGDMFQGGAVIIVNTADVQQHIMKWLCICALKQDCIAPPGAQLYCNSQTLFQYRERYANCHRYDQGLMSILAKNLYNDDRDRYTIPVDELPAVVNRL